MSEKCTWPSNGDKMAILEELKWFKPDECKPQLNGQYGTDEEEFGESNELDIGFREPF